MSEFEEYIFFAKFLFLLFLAEISIYQIKREANGVMTVWQSRLNDLNVGWVIFIVEVQNFTWNIATNKGSSFRWADLLECLIFTYPQERPPIIIVWSPLRIDPCNRRLSLRLPYLVHSLSWNFAMMSRRPLEPSQINPPMIKAAFSVDTTEYSTIELNNYQNAWFGKFEIKLEIENLRCVRIIRCVGPLTGIEIIQFTSDRACRRRWSSCQC